MNDTFSLSRFWLLAKKYTKEQLTTYLLYTAAIMGLLLLVYGLTVLAVLHGRFPQDAAVIYFAVGSIFVGSLFSSSFYGFFQNKAKAVQFLNLPASRAEKLLLSFVFTQLIFFIVFLTGFYLVDQLMCTMYNHLHVMPKKASPEFYPLYHANPMDWNDSTVTRAFVVALVISAISHFGSLAFEKNAFVKTALVILIAGMFFLLANYYSMKAMIPEDIMPGGMFFTRAIRLGTDGVNRGLVVLPEAMSNFLYWFIPSMLYLLFWMSSYYKMREKQI